MKKAGGSENNIYLAITGSTENAHSANADMYMSHKYTIDLLCHFVISNSNPSHYVSIYTLSACTSPYSYYTHASMS